MQFTPQQLSGGARYSNRTRIGNWQEEIVVEESKLDLFKKKSATGSSLLRKQQAKLAQCNEIVPHTFSADGLIRFGDSIIFRHENTGSLLGCDPFEEVSQGTYRYLTTAFAAGPTPSPVARCVFRIVRPPKALCSIEDDDNDPILKIGQPFCLECNESLLVNNDAPILSPTLYLNSTKKNERNATKTTNRQLVYMSPNNDAESVWTLITPSFGKKNGSERFLSKGAPVTIDDTVQITHRQTNMYLTCDPSNGFKSEFGIEFELYADRAAACGKLALIVSEFKGISTTQTLSKPDAPQFAWKVVTSNDENAIIDKKVLPPAPTIDNLLQKIREYILSRGFDGFWYLREYLLELEKRAVSDGSIDREDLKEALIMWGLPIDRRYIDKIIDLKDEKNTGMIDWRGFISLLRGSISDNRKAILKEIFYSLGRGEPKINVDKLNAAFTGSSHPHVANGASSADVFNHLIKLCSKSGRSPSAISYEAFSDYFCDLSPAINDSDDAIFDAIVRNCWS